MDPKEYFEDLPIDPRFSQSLKLFKNGGFFVTEDRVGNPKIWCDIYNNFQAKTDDIYVVTYPRTGIMDPKEYFEDLPIDARYPPLFKRFKNGGFLVTADEVGNPEIWCNIQKNFEAKPDDIYVVTFPRTGTTWTQELVYLIGTDCDFESAKALTTEERFPFLEYPNSKLVENKYPRFIKSHYALSMLPQSIFQKNCKIIYVARNPKDNVVSYFHFLRNFKRNSYDGDLQNFVDLFVEDHLTYSPFSKHVLDFWEKRNEKNICFLFYEDMKKDLPSAIRQMASFLGKSLTEEQVQAIADYCQVENMKKNPAINREYMKAQGRRYKPEMQFIRKGIVGDWKNHFTPEMDAKMNQYIKERFGSTGLQFTYEL